MKRIDFSKRKPQHKDLVLVYDFFGNVLPAIFYSNQSFNGFWKFTTYYEDTPETVYQKVYLKANHEIRNISHWKPFPKFKTK